MYSSDAEVPSKLTKSSLHSKDSSGSSIVQKSSTEDADLPIKKRPLFKKQHPVIKLRSLKKLRNETIVSTLEPIISTVEPIVSIVEPIKPHSEDVFSNPLKCKHCDDGVLEYDTSIGQNYCNSCYLVEESSNLVDLHIQSQVVKPGNANANKAHILRTVPYQRKSHGQQQGLTKIEKVAQQYSLNFHSIASVKEMFNDLYPIIKTKSIRFKEAVAGCCVYKELMNCKIPVLICELLQVIHCQRKDFSGALKVVEERFGKNNAMDKLDVIRAVLKDTSTSLLGKEDFQDFLKKTEDILMLAEQCWLCTGRSTVVLIVACAFFAYKTLLVKCADQQWKTISFKEFCNRFGLSAHFNTAVHRVRELTSLFMKLGQSNLNLMYNGTKIPRKEIELHIDSILLFSDEIIEEFLASQNNNSEDGTLKIDVFRRKRKTVKAPAERMTDEKAKHLNSLPDEEIISDSEMRDYIRTPKEVKHMKRLKKLAHLPVLNKEGKSYLYSNVPDYEQEAANEELCGALLLSSEPEIEHK